MRQQWYTGGSVTSGSFGDSGTLRWSNWRSLFQ